MRDAKSIGMRHSIASIIINPRCACAAKGYCSWSVCLSVGRFVGLSVGLSVWSVGLSVFLHVFSRTVAMVDTKCVYVGRYIGRVAQQESWSGVVEERHFYSGGLKLYTAIIQGVH